MTWNPVFVTLGCEIHIFWYWKCFSNWNFDWDSWIILDSSAYDMVFVVDYCRLRDNQTVFSNNYWKFSKVSYFSNRNSNSMVIWFFWRILVTSTDKLFLLSKGYLYDWNSWRIPRSYAYFQLEFSKHSKILCLFSTGILEEFQEQININFFFSQTASRFLIVICEEFLGHLLF